MPFPEDPNAPKRESLPLLGCGHIACPHCEGHNNINAFFCTVCTEPIWENDPRHELYGRRGAARTFKPQGANHLHEFAEMYEGVQEYEQALSSSEQWDTPQLIQRKAEGRGVPVIQWLTTLHDIRTLPE